MDEPASRRLTPAEVSTEDELRAYVRTLMAARTNVRAVAAETGLSKTTVNELRMGRRRISLDALSKVVGVYAASELTEARAAWQRVQPERRRAPRPSATPAVPTGSVQPAPVPVTADPADDQRPAASDQPTPDPPASSLLASDESAPAHPVPVSPGAPGGGGPADRVAPIDAPPEAAPHRWLPVGLLPRLVYLVIAVLAAVALVQAGMALMALRPSGGTDALSTVSNTSSACISAGQETKAAITTPDSAKTSVVRIKEFAYHLQRGNTPRLEIAGELTGPAPSGQTVQLLEWADPNSYDSTAQHHAGNGRYYPRKTIRVVGRCIYVPEQGVGYAGFTGIRLRYTVVLLPKDLADTMLSDAYGADGLPEQELARYQLVQLGSFTLQP